MIISNFVIYICCLLKISHQKFCDVIVPDLADSSMQQCLYIVFFYESSAHCPMFGLGLLDLLSHTHSCSGCWHWCFDCLGDNGCYISAATTLACVAISVVCENSGTFWNSSMESYAEEFLSDYRLKCYRCIWSNSKQMQQCHLSPSTHCN